MHIHFEHMSLKHVAAIARKSYANHTCSQTLQIHIDTLHHIQSEESWACMLDAVVSRMRKPALSMQAVECTSEHDKSNQIREA
jgi:hypothetical protein